jgi:hypothetical protein
MKRPGHQNRPTEWLNVLTVMVLLVAGATASAGAAETMPPPPTPAPPAIQTITGDVLNIEGEFVVIKDLSGHEVRLQVDKETRMDRLKVGDKVAAVVKSDGHAESITVQLPQTP